LKTDVATPVGNHKRRRLWVPASRGTTSLQGAASAKPEKYLPRQVLGACHSPADNFKWFIKMLIVNTGILETSNVNIKSGRIP
jgi:hypothetical protein